MQQELRPDALRDPKCPDPCPNDLPEVELFLFEAFVQRFQATPQQARHARSTAIGLLGNLQ